MKVIIFDDAGYIAGVQSVLLDRDVDMSVNDLTKQAEKLIVNIPFWKYDGNCTAGVRARHVDGEVAWFTTAYFVDPLVVCNGGRSSF